MAKVIPIVYILDNFYPGGGTENQLITLIENIDRSRFEPHVLNLRHKLDDKSIDIDCPVTYLDTDKPFSWHGMQTIRRVARYLKNVDARIIQVYFYDSRIVGTLAAKLAGTDQIVFCRRDFGWDKSVKNLLIRRWLSGRSDHCIVNARAIRKLVVEQEKFPADKISVIYNGINWAPKPNSKPATKDIFGIPENAPVIGVVANLRPVKQIERLVKASYEMKNKEAHFMIIGEGPLEDELKQMTHDLGLADRFHFHYTVDGVYHLLKLFDIGVQTSRSEGLSNVLIEYALAGLPSIAFDVGGNSEIVINDKTGYILNDGDVDTLAAKIDYLLENRQEGIEMGKRGSEMAVDNFGVKPMVTATENLYQMILE